MSDIVARLRDGIPSQSCDTDSVTFVRCGRGDCACEERLSKEAADEIERLRAALESLTKDPPATLAREPDTDAEVIIKMREIARRVITNGDRGDER